MEYYNYNYSDYNYGDGDFNLSAAYANYYDQNGTFYYYYSYGADEIDGSDSTSILRSVIPFVYLFIFVIGLFGNILVIVVYIRNKTFRTITNMYLLNLAVIDIVYLMVMPLTATNIWLQVWIFGSFLCTLVHYLLLVSMSVHVITLTVIGLDRYFSVVHPVQARHHRSKGKTLAIVGMIWLVSTSAMSPVLTFVKEVEYFNNTKLCIENLTHYHLKIYTLVIFVLLYAIPQVILSFCYVQIARKMKDNVGNNSQFASIRVITIKTRKRMLKIVFTVTLTFVVCWFPVHLVAILFAFGGPTTDWRYYMQSIAPCFSYATTAVNPIIYCFISKTFRKFFISTFKCEKIHLNPFMFGDDAEYKQRTIRRIHTERNPQEAEMRPLQSRVEIPEMHRAGCSHSVRIQVRPADMVYSNT